MISAKQLQNAYNKLYKGLRNYIWPGTVVDQIADLEVACYRTFPDLQEVRNSYNKLKVSFFKYIDEDEDVENAFELFQEILDSSSDLFAKLNTRLEGVK